MVPHHDLEALDDDLIDAVLTANVRGPFVTIRAFARCCAPWVRLPENEEGQHQLGGVAEADVEPIVLPARSASCSVARRIQSARTAMAAMLVRKTQVGGASTR